MSDQLRHGREDLSAVHKQDGNGAGTEADAEIAIEVGGKEAHGGFFRQRVPHGYTRCHCNALNASVVVYSASFIERAGSVPEVAHPGKDHGEAMFVGCGNHLVVTDGTTWLDDRGGPRLGGGQQTVCEREERIRRHRATDRA